MRIAIVGSRTIEDYEYLRRLLAGKTITTIISGGAAGVDELARIYAKEYEIEYMEFPAQWKLNGKQAGILRNSKIVKACDCLIAIWDGKSRGTKSTIDICQEMGKRYKVYIHKGAKDGN